MLRIVAFIFILLASTPSLAHDALDTMEAFHQWIGKNSSSLPTEESLNDLQGVLTPKFIDLIRRSHLASDKCAAAAKTQDERYIAEKKRNGTYTPDDALAITKPDMIEGSLFSTLDTVTEVEYGKTQLKGKTMIVNVTHIEIDQRHKKWDKARANTSPANYELIKIGQSWLIDDVKKGAKNRSVKSILEKFVAHCDLQLGEINISAHRLCSNE